MASDINELAKKCGVSKATISRVFTGKARVSEEVRTKVLAAARELNYRPQQVMARDCIAIIVADTPRPQHRTSFSERLMTSATFEITRRNLLTEIIPVRELAKLYDSYTKGVLLLLSETHIAEYRKELEQLSMPLVTINKEYPFSSSVSTDHGQGITLAMQHLYERGHRRIAMTIDHPGNQASRERTEAYQAFCQSHRLTELPVALFNNLVTELSQQCLDQTFAEKPTALIACGESVALSSTYELQRRGLRIPDDLSLITSEVTDTCCWMTPELTTISQDLDELANETVTLLMNRIHNPSAPRVNRRLPTALIVRNSVKTLPASPVKKTR